MACSEHVILRMININRIMVNTEWAGYLNRRARKHKIIPLSSEDRESVMDIFNYYVENSFAAYSEKKFPYQFFDMFLQMSNGYPRGAIKDENGKTVGFGMLRSHNSMPSFSQTAEVTYFIHPGYTGKGLGKMLLSFLEKDAVEKGITNILASISSLNPGSIRFHEKNGFVECGRFKKVGRKNGQEFDAVWMQQRLQQVVDRERIPGEWRNNNNSRFLSRKKPEAFTKDPS